MFHVGFKKQSQIMISKRIKKAVTREMSKAMVGSCQARSTGMT